MAEESLNSGAGAPLVAYSSKFEKTLVFWKKKDRFLFERLVKQIEKVMQNPAIGKPLRYSLKNRRRLHLGDFDHHDKVYKKY